MRAVSYERTGSSDVLHLGEIDMPEPGRGQVRVKIAVCGVNPTDWRARSGQIGRAIGDAGFQIPGQDGAGTIDAVGDGVDPSRVGERVWLYLAATGGPWGTAAEFCVVPQERAVPLASASFDLGASLGVPALTAHRCLFADGPMDGQGVLVAGGAGAVGHASIELAIQAGANVVATVSGEEKARIAREAGAKYVVNYHDEDATEQIRAALPDGATRIVEVDLAANLELDLAVLAPHGVIVTYGQTGGELSTDAVRELKTLNAILRFVLLYGVPPEALAAAAREVADAAIDGALSTLPLTRFPLERTAEAHDAVEAGAVGKVLIDVA